MVEKVKIGIVGGGSIAKTHIEAYMANPEVELAAICDIDAKQLEHMSEKYGIKNSFSSIDAMLEAMPELDAVSICTWNSAHAPCTIKALNAGKHVLCEKPMAMNAHEAMEMEAAAEKNGRLLMIGFVRRFGNDCVIMKDFVDKDYFGDIYFAKASYLRRNGNPGGWFGDKARSGGGPLIDIGVHVIDLARYIMGNHRAVSVYGATFTKLFDRKNIKTPKEYVSVSASENDICDVEDFVSAMIRFENGAVLHVEASFSLNMGGNKNSIEFFGTKAGAKLDPEISIYSEYNDYLANIGIDGKTALDFNGLFENEINHFIDCVKGRSVCISPPGDGVEIMKILDAVYQSARTGHEVII